MVSVAGAVLVMSGVAAPIGIAVEAVAGVLSVVSALTGSANHAVADALKRLLSSVMHNIEILDKQVASIQASLDQTSFEMMLTGSNNPTLRLRQFARQWAKFVNATGTEKERQKNLFKQLDIQSAIQAWALLSGSLGGANPNGQFGDLFGFDHLLYALTEKKWPRPQQMFDGFNFFFGLLQNSAAAICSYALVFWGDKREGCPVLPQYRDGLSMLIESFHMSWTNFLTEWNKKWDKDEFPTAIQNLISNRGTLAEVQSELDKFYRAPGLSQVLRTAHLALIQIPLTYVQYDIVHTSEIVGYPSVDFELAKVVGWNGSCTNYFDFQPQTMSATTVPKICNRGASGEDYIGCTADPRYSDAILSCATNFLSNGTCDGLTPGGQFDSCANTELKQACIDSKNAGTMDGDVRFLPGEHVNVWSSNEYFQHKPGDVFTSHAKITDQADTKRQYWLFMSGTTTVECYRPYFVADSPYYFNDDSVFQDFRRMHPGNIIGSNGWPSPPGEGAAHYPWPVTMHDRSCSGSCVKLACP